MLITSMGKTAEDKSGECLTYHNIILEKYKGKTWKESLSQVLFSYLKLDFIQLPLEKVLLLFPNYKDELKFYLVRQL
jgi:hypothetical protein